MQDIYRGFAKAILRSLGAPWGMQEVRVKLWHCVLVLLLFVGLLAWWRQPIRGDRELLGFQAPTGSLNTRQLNSIRFADQFPGADCGERINAAVADLGGPGEIWLSQACGPISTAVTLKASQMLRFVQGGAYQQRATITLSGQNSGMDGGAVEASVPNEGYGRTVLKQANGSNLSNMILVSGIGGTLSNLTIDGNRANNPSAGPNIQISAMWVKLNNVNSIFSNSHGIVAGAPTYGKNAAAALHIRDGIMLWNNGSGMLLQNTADVVLDSVGFENNIGYGIDGHDAGAVRIKGGDVGGNKLDGICVHADNAKNSNSATGWLISGVQFGNNGGHDINIQGWNNTLNDSASVANLIVGCSFIGGAPGRIFADDSFKTFNAYDAIHIEDSRLNTVVGNTIADQAGKGWYRYLVGVSESGQGREGQDTIGMNTFNMNPRGTGVLRRAGKTVYASNTNLGQAPTQGFTIFDSGLAVSITTFSSLPRCNPAIVGTMRAISDSTTNAWGTPVEGGGRSAVLAYCNGANWTVAGR